MFWSSKNVECIWDGIRACAWFSSNPAHMLSVCCRENSQSVERALFIRVHDLLKNPDIPKSTKWGRLPAATIKERVSALIDVCFQKHAVSLQQETVVLENCGLGQDVFSKQTGLKWTLLWILSSNIFFCWYAGMGTVENCFPLFKGDQWNDCP